MKDNEVMDICNPATGEGVLEILKTSPRGDVLPLLEAQVRPLLRLPDPDQQVSAWVTAVNDALGSAPGHVGAKPR